MTRYQIWVVRWMRDQRQSAVRFGNQWIWPQDVRRDAELAERIYQFTQAPRRSDEAELDEVAD